MGIAGPIWKRSISAMPVTASRLFIVLALVGSAAAADPVYKWHDERGGIHYGQKPPAGVRALPVDTQPNISVGIKARDCAAPLCPGASSQGSADRSDERVVGRGRSDRDGRDANPRGLDFDVYIRLKSGMSEGELLQRAGAPDFQTVENLRGPIGKSFYYYPTSANPFTTVVTLRGGRILSIERIKKF
jgi:hypothetical protein